MVDRAGVPVASRVSAANVHDVSRLLLVVELQRADLYGQGARGGSRLGGRVDDPHSHAEPGKP
jgi:hypothetical protein